jgi:hypothetical protein
MACSDGAQADKKHMVRIRLINLNLTNAYFLLVEVEQMKSPRRWSWEWRADGPA